MPDADDRAVRLLLKALRSLSDRDRDAVLRYLLSRGSVSAPMAFGTFGGDPMSIGPIVPGEQFDPVTRMLPVRLPAELHERLREWSTSHGFSMAAVARGLIERFLDDQLDR